MKWKHVTLLVVTYFSMAGCQSMHGPAAARSPVARGQTSRVAIEVNPRRGTLGVGSNEYSCTNGGRLRCVTLDPGFGVLDCDCR